MSEDKFNNEATNKMAWPVGKAFKILRCGKRWTIEKVAGQSLGSITVEDLQAIEDGEIFASKDTRATLCSILGCTNEEVWKLAEELASIDRSVPDTDEDFIDLLRHPALGYSFEEVELLKRVSRHKELQSDIQIVIISEECGVPLKDEKGTIERIRAAMAELDEELYDFFNARLPERLRQDRPEPPLEFGLEQ